MATTTVTRETEKEIKIENFITARPVRRTVFDLGDWRRALEYAEMPSGNRVELYDLYDDVMLDPHLSAQWQKRISNITNTDWQVSVDKKENEGLDKLIKSPQFEKVLTEIINTLAWGKTVLELGKTTINRMGKDEEVLKVYSVKRQHLRPKEGLIVKEQYNSAEASTETINYRQGAYLKYVAELGEDTDLGLILKAVPYVLLKRGDVGDWAQFVQLFGMPFREYRYNGYDDTTYQLLKKNAEEMGSAPYMILPDGAQIILHANTGAGGTGAGDVFEKLAKFCDAQISILILGNTETTSSSKSSGYAQSETHLKTEIEVYRDDKKYVKTWLNETIKPILYNLGYDVADGDIQAEKETNLQEVKDRLGIIQQVKTLGEPVDADHIYEVSGVPKPANYDSMKADQEAAKAAEQVAVGNGQKDAKPPKKKATAKDATKLMEDETFWHKLRTTIADFFDPAH
jgi:phage gp29-like protein